MDRQAYTHQGLPNLNEECQKIWAAIMGPGLTQIDRFFPRIAHGQQSTLFGFLDMTLVIPLATGVRVPIKLRNIKVKEVKGSFRIDMPAEKGNDGNWYDTFMPKSGALRAVLTTFVGRDPEVQATIALAANSKPSYEVTAAVPAAQPAPAPQGEETHFSGDLYDAEVGAAPAAGAGGATNNPFAEGGGQPAAPATGGGLPDGVTFE